MRLVQILAGVRPPAQATDRPVGLLRAGELTLAQQLHRLARPLGWRASVHSANAFVQTGTYLPASGPPRSVWHGGRAVIMHRMWPDGTDFRWQRAPDGPAGNAA